MFGSIRIANRHPVLRAVTPAG